MRAVLLVRVEVRLRRLEGDGVCGSVAGVRCARVECRAMRAFPKLIEPAETEPAPETRHEAISKLLDERGRSPKRSSRTFV